MIKNELLKRILTSLVLLPILVFSILYGKFYFGCILFIVFFIASYEWYFINKKSYTVLFSGFFIILVQERLLLTSLQKSFWKKEKMASQRQKNGIAGIWTRGLLHAKQTWYRYTTIPLWGGSEEKQEKGGSAFRKEIEHRKKPRNAITERIF